MSADRVASLAQALGALLGARGLRVATAESCTGGLLAGAITSVAGSSAFFDEGYVTYSNAAKTRLLGVSETLLAAHGAVSEPVVRAMAQGALRASGADVAVAVTGIAGPSGGTPDKPVGTVWLGFARRGGSERAERHRFPGDREAVRRASVEAALAGLVRELGPR